MTIEARKLQLVQFIINDLPESKLSELESIVNLEQLARQKELLAVANQSEKDIEEGNVYTVEEARIEISKRLNKSR